MSFDKRVNSFLAGSISVIRRGSRDRLSGADGVDVGDARADRRRTPPPRNAAASSFWRGYAQLVRAFT